MRDAPHPLPADWPDNRPLPVGRHPQVLVGLVGAGVFTLLAGCAALTVLTITSQAGVLGTVAGVLLAAVPVLPVIAAFGWLDRYEAEPIRLLAFAVAWGAGVATFGALIINTASINALRQAGGQLTVYAALVAPVVEESLKGMALLAVLFALRREFDGVVDGIVYAGMAGVGFAFMENVLYLGRALGESGPGGVAFVFLLRCVVSPFAHPLFTAAIGVGVGVASRTPNRAVALAAPVIGWVVAVLLHGAWNVSAASGLRGFAVAYIVFQVPVFLGVVTVALIARRREGRLIAGHLADYARAGVLTWAEVELVASLPARRQARRWAQRAGGPRARRAMLDFQELGAELAFLRERMIRGTAPRDAAAQEFGMLRALARARARFLTPA